VLVKFKPVVLHTSFEHLHSLGGISRLDVDPAQLHHVLEGQVPFLQVDVQQLQHVVALNVSPLVKWLLIKFQMLVTN
jgi:hypothetical protein